MCDIAIELEGRERALHKHDKEEYYIRLSVGLFQEYHRYKHQRYQTLRHLDPGMGLNLGVFGFFP